MSQTFDMGNTSFRAGNSSTGARIRRPFGNGESDRANRSSDHAKKRGTASSVRAAAAARSDTYGESGPGHGCLPRDSPVGVLLRLTYVPSAGGPLRSGKPFRID